MKEYKCPYCGQNSYSNKGKKRGNFPDWKAVRGHVSKCSKNNKEYYIDLIYGPLHYTLFTTDYYLLIDKYPNLHIPIKSIVKGFRLAGYDIPDIRRKWNRESIIKAIQKFVKLNNRIPEFREWNSHNSTTGYPSTASIKKYFGSWNSGIKAAGFEPNIFNGFGIDTYGKDGHLYRSQVEAYFVNNYLYDKHIYEVEPKYPEPYNKWYDWYLPELDLYIELDGGCRPQIIKEKIDINKKLKRKLLIITPLEVYSNSLVI